MVKTASIWLVALILSPAAAQAAQEIRAHAGPGGPPQTNPPNPVFDLRVDPGSVGEYGLTLLWSSPAWTPGTIQIAQPSEEYQIYASGQPIDSTLAGAWLILGGRAPADVDEPEVHSVYGLDPDTTYHFAIRSRGGQTPSGEPIWSALNSNGPVSATTLPSTYVPPPSPSPSPIAFEHVPGDPDEGACLGSSAGRAGGILALLLLGMILIRR